MHWFESSLDLKNKTMYKFNIKIPIYDCTCRIIISDEIEKIVKKYVKKKKWSKELDLEEGEEIHGLATSNGDTKDYYIFYAIKSLTVNCLTHEISHIADHILEERGIEDGEAKAYLVGYISEKIFDFVFKKGLLINKWINEKPRLLREDHKNDQELQEGLS